jgi:predicted DNA-binding transcriptional regulator AlpA
VVLIAAPSVLLKYQTVRNCMPGPFAGPAVALVSLDACRRIDLLTVEQVPSFIPVSASTWRRGVKSGHFPAGVHLSPKSVFWRVDSIRASLPSP